MGTLGGQIYRILRQCNGGTFRQIAKKLSHKTHGGKGQIRQIAIKHSAGLKLGQNSKSETVTKLKTQQPNKMNLWQPFKILQCSFYNWVFQGELLFP